MAYKVRRVVMGHDTEGKSVVKTDEVLTAASRGGDGKFVAGCEIWSTNRIPVDNAPEADADQRAGFVDKGIPRNNYVRGGGGTLLRMIEWAAGNPAYTHRTETVDYVIIVSGEIDHECDGETVQLKAGDVLVQRRDSYLDEQGFSSLCHGGRDDRRYSGRDQRQETDHSLSRRFHRRAAITFETRLFVAAADEGPHLAASVRHPVKHDGQKAIRSRTWWRQAS